MKSCARCQKDIEDDNEYYTQLFLCKLCYNIKMQQYEIDLSSLQEDKK